MSPIQQGRSAPFIAIPPTFSAAQARFHAEGRMALQRRGRRKEQSHGEVSAV
jgi:hypothetical protein